MSGIVVKDHSIKLFGKTIDLLPFIEQIQSSSVTSTSQETKDLSGGEITHEFDESTNPTDETSSEISDGTAAQSPTKNSEISQTESSSNTSPEKETLKKPDEILPCPRCESMDTKFCYFNNYNVNQPRYFCRKCQRYWTCGGTMRNVPVGSGRRKNKNVVVQNYGHVIVQESGAGHHLNPNGFFIFGPTGPSNGDPNSTRNGFPVAFYPTASYWGSAVTSPPWNIPLNPESSVLGKHPREEKTMIRPKTLRIDDPNEAAKSSIWSTIGMKREKIGSFAFKAFDPKIRHNNNRSVDSTETVLQANPAALSRSVNFQELA
ncbi:hypothetical protein ACP275_12G103200 [Erythranthe tilingii]